MDQKEFDSKLDEYANKISTAVGDGVKRMEEVFEKGKENLRASQDEEGAEGKVGGWRGSPKMGLILVVGGILWLLYTFGVFAQPVFPILMIVLGLYFIIRNR